MSTYKIIDQTTTQQPTVSVAMLAYNHQEFISEAIESVLMQKITFPIQIVIAEDCSPDNTRAIVLEYQTKYPDIIKLILQDKNVGASQNNDALLNHLDGQYIAPLEGDDYWIDEYKLQQQVDFLEHNQEYNLVYTDAKYYKQNTGEFDLQRTNQIKDFSDLLVSNRMFTLTVCLKKEVLDIYRQEDANDLKDLPFGDYSLWLFASTRGQAKYLPIVSAVYRILEESASHSKNLEKLVSFEEAVSKCRLYFLNKYYNGDKKQLETKLLGAKTRSIIKMSFLYKDEKVFNQYKKDLKYIANYKYKYYLIYSLAKINFKVFTAIYN
ncbi:glycosyltransferase [Myroides sp. M-43]|uniref:glycosyltransferase n=1 Tax=Myroides oncorhynchi TaxID=2893756 RepID=UPI001E6269B1|nr:glycosyltransferase [Myroides oncorhynchi]MCC9043493.1 glycosyltransferase [Myroides oncorhynchi]